MRVGTRVRLSPIEGNDSYYSYRFIDQEGTILELLDPDKYDERWQAVVKFDKSYSGRDTQVVWFCDCVKLDDREIDIDKIEIKDLF